MDEEYYFLTNFQCSLNMVTVDPKGDGIALLSTSIVFLAVTWLTFVARLAVRVRRKAVGLDDHAMAAGLVREQLFSTL